MRFVCDFDGIAYPFVTAVAEHPRGRGLTLENCLEWETPIHVVGEEHWLDAWEQALSYDTMRRVGLFPDFAPALSSLRARGVEPVLITHRPEEAVQAVKRLLAEEGLGWLEVRQGSPAEKVDFCLAEDVRVLVDDHPETLALADAAGISVLSLRFPYNQAVLDRIGAVNALDWGELEGLLLQTIEHRYAHRAGVGPSPLNLS